MTPPVQPRPQTTVARMIPEYRSRGERELGKLLAAGLGITLAGGLVVSAVCFAISWYLADVYESPGI